MKVFVSVPNSSGCSLYRATLPVLHCYHELSKHGIQLIGDYQPLNNEMFDTYLFHRIIKPEFMGFVNSLFERKIKVIWQTDDDLENIPKSNPAFDKVTPQDLKILSYIKEKCNSIFVSTETLTKTMPPEKTYVLPNLVDLSFFKQRTYEEDQIKVLWAGSPSHNEDLLNIINPILSLREKYPNVHFIFFGYFPTEFAKFERVHAKDHAKLVPKYDNIWYVPWAEGRKYFDVLNELKPDIAISPLADNAFNKSKSNLKSIEMISAYGAFIGSNVEPYNWIENDCTGMLVSNDEQFWFNGIEKLILDEKLRHYLVENGQKIIKERYCWQSDAKDIWINAFLKTIKA